MILVVVTSVSQRSSLIITDLYIMFVRLYNSIHCDISDFWLRAFNSTTPFGRSFCSICLILLHCDCYNSHLL